MSEVQIQHESLLLPGYWRITAFGKLTENPRSLNPDLRIHAYLGQLSDQDPGLVASSAMAGPIQVMKLPVGEIPRLYINAVLRDGRLVSADQINRISSEEILTRVLACHRDNIKVIERFEKDECGQNVIPVSERRVSLLRDPDLHVHFVAIGSPDDPYATIIPAIEIFRFFYATSDVLAKALLRDDFLDPYTHIWNPEKTCLQSDLNALIWLRKRMLDADARFIARFAFDEYALRQAQRIFLYSSASGRSGSGRTLWSIPPFEDVVNLKLVCWRIGGPDGNRVLATRILQCDWKPSWKHLDWDRDNDGRADVDSRNEKSPAGWNPNVQPILTKAPPTPTILSAAPPSLDLVPSRLKEEEIAERFPELQKTPAKKLPQESAKTRAAVRTWKEVVQATFPGSVVEGRSSLEIVGKTIIEGLEQKPVPQKEETDAVDATIGQNDYLTVLRLLQFIENHKLAEARFISVLPTTAKAFGVEFNVYPEEVDGKKTAWLYVDDAKQNRRMALLASLNFEDRIRYVIELQQKQPGECATIVVWQREELKLPPGFLAQLILDCARAKGTTLRSALFLRVYWNRLRHTTKEENQDSAKHFLGRIFDATPLA